MRNDEHLHNLENNRQQLDKLAAEVFQDQDVLLKRARQMLGNPGQSISISSSPPPKHISNNLHSKNKSLNFSKSSYGQSSHQNSYQTSNNLPPKNSSISSFSPSEDDLIRELFRNNGLRIPLKFDKLSLVNNLLTCYREKHKDNDIFRRENEELKKNSSDEIMRLEKKIAESEKARTRDVGTLLLQNEVLKSYDSQKFNAQLTEEQWRQDKINQQNKELVQQVEHLQRVCAELSEATASTQTNHAATKRALEVSEAKLNKTLSNLAVSADETEHLSRRVSELSTQLGDAQNQRLDALKLAEEANRRNVTIQNERDEKDQAVLTSQQQLEELNTKTITLANLYEKVNTCHALNYTYI